MSRPAATRALLLALLGATPACNDVTLPSLGYPVFITIETGDGQSAEVATPLAESLAVRVTDGKGRPVRDAIVHFAPLDLADGGYLIPDSVATNADGRSATRWVLGTRAGRVRLAARVVGGLGDAITATFSAIALPGPAAFTRLVQGDGQTTTAGQLLGDSLVVRVVDRYDNPRAGESIAWHTDDGGALSLDTVLSDTLGRSAVSWRLGPPAGPQSVLATAAALPAAPLTFRATALPDEAVALLRTFGDSQVAPVGAPLTDSVVARLVDQFGNGVPSRSVTWVAGGGGGTATPATGTTDANGFAFSRWTLGPASGVQLMNAVVSGYTPATFTALAVSQSASTIEPVGSTALVGPAGAPVSPPPSVRVVDPNGNPVPGVAVTFSTSGGRGRVANQSGAGSSVTVATDAAGVAAVTAWTLGAATGVDTLEATAAGPGGPLAGSPVRFVAFVLPGPASALAFVQQPTSTPAGVPMSPPVTVGVYDAFGNLASSFVGTVTLGLATAPPGGAVGGTTTVAVAGGIATFGGVTFDVAGSGYSLVANARPALSAATSSVFEVTAGAGIRLAIVTQPSDTTVSGATLVRQPVVRLVDGLGNAIPQANLAVTASIATGGGALAGTATVSTDASGVATFTDLSLSGLIGTRTLAFAAGGLSPIASSPVVVTTGPAAVLTLAAGGGQTADVGTLVAVLPAVRVTDLSGNPVPGIAVGFAVTGGGGSITGADAVTDVSGTAAVTSWRLGPTKGLNTLTAAAAGITGPTLTVTAVGRFAWVTLRAGAEFSCGVSTAGVTYCWGRNNQGQLGNGTTTDQLVPTPITAGLMFQNLGLGHEHACGLTAAGAAYCWGLNTSGQLGDGSTMNRPTPVAVGGQLAFTTIEAGDAHTCAITAAGAAWCWGMNNRGQLGDGSTTLRSTPTAVTGALQLTALAMGTQFTCGLATGGAAYCWGLNSDGQLGDGTKKNRPTPGPVTGSGWTALAAGEEHTCALGQGGAAWCWGRNDKGQLGSAGKGNNNQPEPVSGGLSFAGLDAGGRHSCAMTAAGVVFCWGQNANGELGDGTTADRQAPTPVQGGLTSARISAGGVHTLLLTPTGAGYRWGRDGTGVKTVPEVVEP